MKKKIFIPAGIAACLAFGIVSTVSAENNSQTAAYVKDIVDSDNFVFDSIMDNLGKRSDASDNDSVAVLNFNKDNSFIPAVAAVSFEDNSESDKPVITEAPEPTVASTNDIAVQAQDDVYIAPKDTFIEYSDTASAADSLADNQIIEDSFIDEINENIVTPVDNAVHADDSKELSELENEIKPVNGQSPDDDEKAADISDSESAAASDFDDVFDSDEASEHVHEHIWKPVTETVHHDAQTHMEEVWIDLVDNNKSFSYGIENDDGTYECVCSVHVYGTVEEYHNDELYSVEGDDKAGAVGIHNHITGESFTFAPGDLEDINSFVNDMFDFEVENVGALIGPAFCYVEEVEVVDKEAYDEEVITGYVCDCGDDKYL